MVHQTPGLVCTSGFGIIVWFNKNEMKKKKDRKRPHAGWTCSQKSLLKIICGGDLADCM